MATFYFLGGEDTYWNTLGNWWQDSDCSVPATSLPTSSDDVFVGGGQLESSASPVTIANLTWDSFMPFAMNITVTGDAIFYQSSNQATLTGNAKFYLGSSNQGTVTTALFSDYSANSGTVVGNAVFESEAKNYGTVGGDATFEDSSQNYTIDPEYLAGTIDGDLTYRSLITLGGVANGDMDVGVANDIASDFVYSGSGNITLRDGVYNTADLSSASSIEFLDSSSNWGVGGPCVVGNAVFRDNSRNHGLVAGNAVFEGSSRMEFMPLYDPMSNVPPVVTGNVTFKGSAYNKNGSIEGTVTLAYEKGVNGSSILGVV